MADRGYGVVVTGGAEDVAASDALVAACAGDDVSARSVAGTPWPETLAWLADAAGVVSVNTGLMHIAAAVGAPTVALNGPTSTTRWGPIGERTRSVTSPLVPDGYLNLGFERDERYRGAMAAIDVPRVLATCDELFGAATSWGAEGTSGSDA
jgi:hypothetical protein